MELLCFNVLAYRADLMWMSLVLFFCRIKNRGYSVKPIARTIILWRTLGSISFFLVKTVK